MADRTVTTTTPTRRKNPVPVATGRFRKRAASTAAKPATATAAMPGPAALAATLPALWDQHRRLSLAKAPMSERATMARINATEAMAISAPAETSADAVAQLLLLFSEVYLEASEVDGEESTCLVRLIETACRPLAVLSRHAGFDLAGVGGPYLTPNMAAVIGGEVVA